MAPLPLLILLSILGLAACEKKAEGAGGPTTDVPQVAAGNGLPSVAASPTDAPPQAIKNPLIGTWIALDGSVESDGRGRLFFYPEVYQFNDDTMSSISVDCCKTSTKQVSYRVSGNAIQILHPDTSDIDTVQVVSPEYATSNSDHFTIGGYMYLKRCKSSDMAVCYKDALAADSAWNTHAGPPPNSPAAAFNAEQPDTTSGATS